MSAGKPAYSSGMEPLPVLKHLSAVCHEALEESGQHAVDVASRYGSTQNTVDRFLKAKNYPRRWDLDRMVSVIADVSFRPPGDLWREAINRAEAELAAGEDESHEADLKLAAEVARQGSPEAQTGQQPRRASGDR